MTTYVLLGIIAVTLLIVIAVLIAARKKRYSKREQEFFRSQWQRVEETIEKDPKQAILEADKLIDKALALKGYQGSLGEKLKKAGTLFSDVNALWSAHKHRNKIAHEIGYTPSQEDTRRSVYAYKKALENLQLTL